jgi:exodeoxyribonuclease-3
VWQGQKSWNGVAIPPRRPSVLTRTELPGDRADTQACYTEAAVNGMLVATIYALHGDPQPGPKFEY